jgi:hypothetical protein
MLSACALNSTQEKSLNRAIIQYQNAYNKGLTILEVSLTHPCVVDAVYKDSLTLIKQFIHSNITMVNYEIDQVEESGKEMRVKLIFSRFDNDKQDTLSKKIIYALSADEGKTWFFAESRFLSQLKCNRSNINKKN